ncbi:STAS domain-containing protein [Kitasatospora sp. NBC_01287]|uniref:STAS domain-containing protein n=1 Tax=Kitasatospora sp. NBC_01287 TaxID=2903573 RepID=UPI0022557093|nr:STAS domain-containing protein [Kitasatospora sp. NBC_01287]MCX4744635.1 STAS domain-containing protein [Kitasatospora sp. NBC_01287]
MQSSAGEGTGTPADRLTVAVRVHGRSVVVSPAGELDHDSVGLLHERLVDALSRPDSDRLVVDCRDLWFCDSTGLNTLLAARRDAEQAGAALVLAGLQPAVARVFEITGADTVFDIRPDLDAVLR